MTKRILFLLVLVFLYFISSNRIIYADDASDLKQEISNIQSDGNYIGALLFNAFGTNPDNAFASYVLTDDQIKTICNGSCGKIGINSGAYYSQAGTFYQRAKTNGMQFTLEIARNDTASVVSGLNNANANGETPVIRIGVNADSGGFSDPHTYVSFLQNIDGLVSFPVYAIAGPNEPETESWATPTCGTDATCIGKGLATYMNIVISGAGNLHNVKLLSPAFNMTDKASPPIVLAMEDAGANFNGVVAIAGNSYNISGVGITKWVSNFMSATGLSGHSILLTEIGSSSLAVPGTVPKPFDFTKEVPCKDTNDPEFHSLRPYPANPCDNSSQQDEAMLCANDLVVIKIPNPNDTYKTSCTPPSTNGSYTCTYTNVPFSSAVSVNLTGAELPIMGNTEDVPNATWTSPNTAAPNLSAAQRMNNYVSWYLNGVVNKAEEDFSSFNSDLLVNYSGPLNKLLPWASQTNDRIASINNATTTTNSPSAPVGDKSARHNEIVGCPWIDKLYGIGLPLPCYIQNEFVNNLIDSITSSGSLAEKIAALVLKASLIKNETRLVDWNNWMPPLESDPKYKTFEEYWKDYLTWRGNVCSPNLLGTKFYLCAGLSNAFTVWSHLFAYTPSSTTEDRVGLIGTNTPAINPGSCATVGAPCSTTCANGKTFSDSCPGNGSFASCSQWANQACGTVGSTATGNLGVSFTPSNDTNYQHNLYFAHMQEDAELSSKLQSTFESAMTSSTSSKNTGPNIGAGCVIQKADSRTNPGDSLHGDIDRTTDTGTLDHLIAGTVDFTATYTCTFTPTLGGGFSSVCSKVSASLGIFTKTPEALSNWNSLVGGNMSIFKKIYPKVGNDSPVTEIKETPARTQATYQSTGGDSVAAGTANSTNGSSATADVYFPYIGGIQDYFLTGIQIALRPQGYGSGSITASNNSSGSTGGNVAGSCKPEDMSIFGDPQEAATAACIAGHESSCHVDSVNASCLKEGGTQDYSIGLFQINLIASLNRCPGAFDPKNGGNLGTYVNGHAVIPCKIGDQDALDACVQKLEDPNYNEQVASQMYKNSKANGRPWSDWAADAKACNL